MRSAMIEIDAAAPDLSGAAFVFVDDGKERNAYFVPPKRKFTFARTR